MLEMSEYLKKLRLERVNLMTTISANSCQSFDDYRYMCGRLRGFQEAEDHFQEMYDRMINPQNQVKEGTIEDEF